MKRGSKDSGRLQLSLHTISRNFGEKSNGTDDVDWVRPEYFVRLVISVGRTEMFLSIFTKLLSPVPLFYIRLQVQLPNTRWPGSGSMQPLCTAPLGTWNFRKFLTGIFVMERRSLIPTRIPHLLAFLADIVVVVTLP